MNNTHMPFLSRCGAEEISLCCRKVNGFWKLHQKVGDDWVRLNTQRPDDATECSPTAEYQDGANFGVMRRFAPDGRLIKEVRLDNNITVTTQPKKKK